MIFEHDDRKYELHKDPTVRASKNVTAYDNKLKLAYIDLSILTEEDMKKSIDEIREAQFKSKPLLLAEYDSEVVHAETIRTIMLCTEMTEIEVQSVPIEILFEKCYEIMGGTASDFFLRRMKSLMSKRTRTMNLSKG